MDSLSLKIKPAAKIAGFIIGLMILLKIMSFLFGGGFWFAKGYIYDRNARNAALSLETKGQIDVLNIGDSLSTTALTPLELFRDYGYTAYNCGQDRQTPIESYFSIRTARRTQPIKVVLFEIHNLFEKKYDEGFPKTYVTEYAQYEFPILRYHYAWLQYWKKRSIRKYFKGFLINDGHDAYSGEEYYDWDNEERAKIYKYHKKMLFEIADYCKRHDIKLVLYSAPSPECYDITIHNLMTDLSQELGVDYIDANYDRDKIQMNWRKDTNDAGDHLNLSGSRRMTVYIGDYLRDNCELADHRPDPAYQPWFDLQSVYEETIVEMKGTYYSILEDELGFND